MIKIGAGNLNEVFEELEREKGISKEVVISSLCDAMVAAYKKHLRIKEIENVEAFLDEQSGEIGIFKGKIVVESVEDADNEISLAEAKEIDDSVELGDEVKLEVTPDQFGRIAAQAANQVLTQRIREAERNLVLNEFLDKKGTLIYTGDCVQVLFSRTAVGDRWKFGFALDNNGKVQTFCWNAPKDRDRAKLLAAVKTVITRNEKDKETLYRIEFPAKELGIIPGKPFRFNIQLNDNDGRCRVGFHAIAEVRDDGKNDTGFPEITFNNF